MYYPLFTKNINKEVKMLENKDQINPDHYKKGLKIETIEAILSQLTYPEAVGYLKGSALKYICRMGKKDGEPASIASEKASWFLQRLNRYFRERVADE